MEAVYVAAVLRRPHGNLGAKCYRQRMLTERASDHRGVAVSLSETDQFLLQRLHLLNHQGACIKQLQNHHSVIDIDGRHTKMQCIAGRLAE